MLFPPGVSLEGFFQENSLRFELVSLLNLKSKDGNGPKLHKRQSGPFAIRPFFFADQLVTKPVWTWNDVVMAVCLAIFCACFVFEVLGKPQAVNFFQKLLKGMGNSM